MKTSPVFLRSSLTTDILDTLCLVVLFSTPLWIDRFAALILWIVFGGI